MLFGSERNCILGLSDAARMGLERFNRSLKFYAEAVKFSMPRRGGAKTASAVKF